MCAKRPCAGRKPREAAKDGFAHALSTIIDANLTTFITGFILYKFGTGPVQGFATTLCIGIVTSVFAALVITRVLVHLKLEKGVDSFPMARLINETKIDFMGKAKVAMMGSAVLVLAGVGLFASIPDKDKLGIDFLGGVTMTVRTEEPQQVQAMRDRVRDIGGIIGESSEVKAILASGSDAAGFNQFRVTFKTEGDPREQSAEDRDLKDSVQSEVQSALASVLEKGPFQVSVEGTAANGTLYFEAPHPEADVKSVLEEIGVTEVTVTRVTGPTAAYAFQGTIGVEKADAINGLIQDGFEKLRTESGSLVARTDSSGAEYAWANPIPEIAVVGAQVVSELRDKAIFAILLSLFAAVMYIRVRFAEYSYGIAAVVALVHDVMITLGVLGIVIMFDLVDAEISLPMIAAFLTIIGYSLNDTIVVFDRVRENLPRMKGSLSNVINTSINQTLARTVLTSVTTLLTVVILLVANFNTRNVLEGFAFALTIGVMVGTYSSMFIASPVLLWLESRRQKQVAAAEAAAEGDTAKVAATT